MGKCLGMSIFTDRLVDCATLVLDATRKSTNALARTRKTTIRRLLIRRSVARDFTMRLPFPPVQTGHQMKVKTSIRLAEQHQRGTVRSTSVRERRNSTPVARVHQVFLNLEVS